MIYITQNIMALAMALTEAGYNVAVSESKWESLYPPIEGLTSPDTGYFANHRLGMYLYPSLGSEAIESEYRYIQDDIWTEEYVHKMVEEVFTEWVRKYTDTDKDPTEPEEWDGPADEYEERKIQSL